jgi:hypothetical protein
MALDVLATVLLAWNQGRGIEMTHLSSVNRGKFSWHFGHWCGKSGSVVEVDAEIGWMRVEDEGVSVVVKSIEGTVTVEGMTCEKFGREYRCS